MFIPMLGFIITLLIVGGLATLVAVGDPQNARLAPFIAFVSLFAGLGAFTFSVALAFIGDLIVRSETAYGLGFFMGYVLGGLGGAILGLSVAMRRRDRIESEAHE